MQIRHLQSPKDIPPPLLILRHRLGVHVGEHLVRDDLELVIRRNKPRDVHALGPVPAPHSLGVIHPHDLLGNLLEPQRRNVQPPRGTARRGTLLQHLALRVAVAAQVERVAVQRLLEPKVVDAVNRGDLTTATEQHKKLRAARPRRDDSRAGHGIREIHSPRPGRISSPRVRLPLVGPEGQWEAAVIEDELALVTDIEGVDLSNFRPDRNAAAGGALPKVPGTTR